MSPQDNPHIRPGERPPETPSPPHTIEVRFRSSGNPTVTPDPLPNQHPSNSVHWRFFPEEGSDIEFVRITFQDEKAKYFKGHTSNSDVWRPGAGDRLMGNVPKREEGTFNDKYKITWKRTLADREEELDPTIIVTDP